MKTLGLIGGMSWESTAIYYKLMNEMVKERLGGLHSAKIILWSFDFDEIAKMQLEGNWESATERMIEAGCKLKDAGADALVICTNTMHKMAGDVEAVAGIPVIHIVDGTAAAIKKKKFRTVGLLATAFTMEEEFYKGRLRDNHNIEAIVPDEADRKVVHRVIYEELCKGIGKEESKQKYLEIIQKLIGQGAEGIILGCTEIGMLIKETDVPVPVFETTALHAMAAVEFAINSNHS